MIRSLIRLDWFRQRPQAGAVLLRVFLGSVLVYGTQDNVFRAARMLEFRNFLAGAGFPYPLWSAYLSAYAQFSCGVLILVGAGTRYAAALMMGNFVVALAMVHRTTPFDQNIAPLAMLFCSLFLLFHGPGPFSVDGVLWTRAQPAGEPSRSAPGF